MKKTIIFLILTATISVWSQKSSTTGKKEVPDGYLGVKFGDTSEKVIKSLQGQKIDLVSSKKRWAINGINWIDVAVPDKGRMKKDKQYRAQIEGLENKNYEIVLKKHMLKDPYAPERAYARQQISAILKKYDINKDRHLDKKEREAIKDAEDKKVFDQYDMNNDGNISEDEIIEQDNKNLQKVIIGIKFLGEEKTRRVISFINRTPHPAYVNYMLIYYYFTTDDKLYSIVCDMTKIELLDYDYNYLYTDLSGTDKYGPPRNESTKISYSGGTKYVTFTHTWFNKDKSRRLESKILQVEKSGELIQFRPITIMYNDLVTGEEFLNPTKFSHKKNSKAIENMKF